MPKSKEVSNTIEITKSPPKDKSVVISRYPFDINIVDKKIIQLYDSIYSALKIISIGLSDEMTDFFSDYSNIKTFIGLFSKFSIAYNKDDFTKEMFVKNPNGTWKLLIAMLIMMISALPNRGGTYSDSMIFNGLIHKFISISLDTNMMDGKSHVVGVMITSEAECSAVTIDGDVILCD